MEKPILYSDCDGVILNTLDVAYAIMQQHGVDIRSREEVTRYFRNYIDWKELISKAEVINNAAYLLRHIKDIKMFEDVKVLTKISGGQQEEQSKRELFRRILPKIEVITLHVDSSKALAVPAAGNLLVDDDLDNCNEWREQNGEAVLFTPYMYNYDRNIISTFADIQHTAAAKKLLKTRNF